MMHGTINIKYILVITFLLVVFFLNIKIEYNFKPNGMVTLKCPL